MLRRLHWPSRRRQRVCRRRKALHWLFEAFPPIFELSLIPLNALVEKLRLRRRRLKPGLRKRRLKLGPRPRPEPGLRPRQCQRLGRRLRLRLGLRISEGVGRRSDRR